MSSKANISQAGVAAPRRSQIAVLDSTMSYVETGASGPTVLFLHGNPTSSHIWRNIIPYVAPLGRCIAPDLIGYGQSGKPDIDYRFFDHVRYLDAFLDVLDIQEVVLVAQDWGTALAFHLAARRPQRVLGLAFMEFIRPFERWEDFHQRPQAREMFKALRTPGVGEKLVLEDNVFVEKVLPASVLRTLSDEEMTVYRAPFPTPQSRKPVLRLPRELPIEGQPADVAAISEHDHRALRLSTYPKLLFAGDPGALIAPQAAREFAAGLKNCRFINLGPGAHYLQEDHADAIGGTIAGWLPEVFQASRTAELA
ncbi:haloalkane dehalogenase [Mesorhizobium sp. M7A.F.Ca.US.014.04.1.1]|uniref:haloalkane dehalogenase n=2 Tax=Phyllobacteriaceae TaxID=69277 RepID=UPI0007A94C7D|nr:MULTISPECIES: haloalkane dehalogenase [Mesorhizobium]AMX96481.1 haloalkane dehalogenase [Mesorhizobium ciceri]MDF3206683.1 haloalkane dehalogenase [Mesorhizobium sp. LMG15046]MDF3230249.1 haloalkane dehalogenase [Mesorhizobium sp. DSM 30133]RUU21580.1 haloalkane dehalogenase [Mesorhizobium sp. Primo-B]RUU41049.1 haloalkane dehalogenase [Mesorhizobium sp. Primo-A]